VAISEITSADYIGLATTSRGASFQASISPAKAVSYFSTIEDSEPVLSLAKYAANSDSARGLS